MSAIQLSIFNKQNKLREGKNDYEEFLTVMQKKSTNSVFLATQELYFEDGDYIHVKLDKPNVFLIVKLDETMDSSLVYIKNYEWHYYISMSENSKEARSDLSFTGKRHYISVRLATLEEIESYRNLALNPHDQKDFNGAFPHAHANVETRNNATFFACNAINGIYANNSHGSYPYHSWGINRQEDAELTIDFGRAVLLDKIGIVLRADFPHDSFWTNVTVTFSDGSTETFNTIKTEAPQYFSFPKRETETIILHQLIKAEDDSPFPALTEIEFFGNNVV